MKKGNWGGKVRDVVVILVDAGGSKYVGAEVGTIASVGAAVFLPKR